MADRTAAAIFGVIFEELAKLPGGGARTSAVERIWAEAKKYDFTPDQMEADAALHALGLARKGEEGWEYGPKPPPEPASKRHG